MACDSKAVNIQELASAVGTDIQADIATASTAYLRVPQINPDLANVELKQEDDGADIGKGDEFPTQLIPTNWDVSKTLKYYLNSHMVQWALGFGIGKFTTATAGGGTRHTCVVLDPVADGICMPLFSAVEAFRQDGDPAVLDRLLVGLAIEGFQIDLTSGPGRQNAQLSVDIVGSGRFTDPSGVTLPAVTAQKRLDATNLSCTINGTNYVTAKSFVSLSFAWKNNVRLDTGYFPGSGSQNGGSVRGRMEFGTRQASLRFVVRFAEDSDEITKMEAQTTGSAVFGIVGATGNDFQVTLPKVGYKTSILGNDNGLLTVAVEVTPLKHATNGYITAYATTN